MLIGERTAAWAKSSGGTSRPSYIETDGACFFDTGIYLRTPFVVEYGYYVTGTGKGYIWGAYRMSSIQVRAASGNSSGSWNTAVIYPGGDLNIAVNPTGAAYPQEADCVLTADARSQTLTAFDTSASGSSASGITDTLTVTCGLMGYKDTTSFYPMGSDSRLRYWRYWHDGVLTANILPSFGEDGNTPCFKDEVSGNYLYNLGTGTPAAGPVVA